MKNSLMSQMNMKGRGEKTALIPTEIYKVLLGKFKMGSELNPSIFRSQNKVLYVLQ